MRVVERVRHLSEQLNLLHAMLAIFILLKLQRLRIVFALCVTIPIMSRHQRPRQVTQFLLTALRLSLSVVVLPGEFSPLVTMNHIQNLQQQQLPTLSVLVLLTLIQVPQRVVP